MEKETFISREELDKIKHERFILVGTFRSHLTTLAVMGVKTSKIFHIVLKHYYKTHEIQSIPSVINDILKEAKEVFNIEISNACFGVAGPVPRKRDYVKMTNLDLEINISDILSNTLLKKAILVNSFEAIGFGIDMLNLKEDVIKIPHVGEDKTDGWTFSSTIAVIGARSGLGMSIAPYYKDKYLHSPIPSEGGHIDLVPYDDLEYELIKFLKDRKLTKKDVHPEFERVLSAEGISNIFDFLIERDEYKSEDEIVHRVKQLKGIDKIEEIEANYDNYITCKKTIDMYISFYGRVAKSVALICECYSGLFLVGQLARRNLNRYHGEKFMEVFEKHDKRSDVLRKVPVYVITNKNVDLYGCCNVAVNFYNIS